MFIWEPNTRLDEGLKDTFHWIHGPHKKRAAG